MSEKIRLDRKIGFQNMFYTKCINVRIDSIGPSIILRSIDKLATCKLLIALQSNKVAKIRNRYNQVPHLTQDTKSL